MAQSQPSEGSPSRSRRPRPRLLAAPASLAALSLIALPAFAYCLLLATTAVNVPYLDDFDTVLRFLLETREADAETLKLLFAQHVEHRLVLLRVTALAMAGAAGDVDFVVFAWLGSLGLALLAAALFAAWRPHAPLRGKLLGFAPAALFLFQPQFWDAFFWATSALSNLWVLPLVLSSLLALAREGPLAMASAAALAAIAATTQGNGLLVLPAGLLLLALQQRPGAALLWCGVSALLGGLYALDFQPVDGAPSWLESLQRTPTLVHYALNFLGSAPGFSHPLWSPLCGALLLCSSAALWLAGCQKQNPVLYTLLLLLAASAALNALGRGHISGADYPLASIRYRFYSSAMLAVSYLCWAEWFATRVAAGEPLDPSDQSRQARPAERRSRSFLAASLAVALLFSSLSYGLYAPKAIETSKRLRGGLQHWRTTGRGLRHPDVRHAGAILARAVEQGLYAPEL